MIWVVSAPRLFDTLNDGYSAFAIARIAVRNFTRQGVGLNDSISLEDSLKSEKELLRDKLISRESTIGTLFGSIIGAVPGFVLFWMFVVQGFPVFLASFIPGIFVGLGARLLGRGILDRHGRIAGAVVFVVQTFFWWLAELPLLAIAFSIPGVIAALFIAPRGLTHEEGMAVYDYRIGRWRPESG